MNERKIGILLSYLNIFFNAIIGLAYVPILLHYIGKEEYGLFQLIGSFIAYFSIMDFGLTNAVVRFYTKYKALQDTVNMENILAMAMRAYVVITGIMLAAGLGFYFTLPNLFSQSMTGAEIETAKQLFLLLLFNMVITISTMIFRAVINAHEKFLFLKGLEIIQLVLQPILVILVLQQYPSAFSVAFVQTILNVILIIARVYYCIKKLRVTIRYHYWDKVLFADFKKLALSLFAVTLIDQVFFKTNQIILGFISGTSSVAVYSVSSIIYMNYMLLALAISGVYLPYVTELTAQKVPIEILTDLFISIGRIQFFVLALVASGFIIFGQEFIKMWAGESFLEAYDITLLIIIPFTVDLIQNIGLSIMQAQNKYDFRAKVYFVMGVFNLCLAIPLAQKFGGVGCAFATGLSMFLGNGVIMNWYYSKVTGLDIVRFWKEIGKIGIVVSLLTVFGIRCNYIVADLMGPFVFMCKILVYTILYLGLIFILCMNREEKRKLLNILNIHKNC